MPTRSALLSLAVVGCNLDLISSFPEEAVFYGNGRTRTEYCAFVVEAGDLVGYYYYNLNDQISHAERLHKSMAPIKPKEAYTELLKLGILSGEFKKFSAEVVSGE